MCLWFSTVVVAADDSRIELTAEEKAWLAEHPDIALGAAPSFPPFLIKTDDGTYEGVLVDYLKVASQILNHRIHPHTEDSWTKVQEMAEKREIDGLAIGGKSPDRAAFYHPTEPLITTYFSVFARSQNEHQIEQFTDLDGLQIGYKSGAKPTRALLEKLPSATLKTYDNNEALTQALLSKEVDVVVAWISYDYFRKNNLQGMIENILLIDEYPMEMVTHIRKDWPELVSIMDKVIEVMREDELPRIANKWFLDWPQQPKAASVQLTPEERAWLKAHPEITLGATASFPPHMIKNPDGTYKGVLPEVYEQISQLLDTKFNLYVGESWSSVQKQAENKELDGLAIGGRDPGRDKYYNATDQLYPSYTSVFAANKHDLKIHSFKDLDGMHIGYKRGARPTTTNLEGLHSAIIKPYDDHESMTQALLTKEVDVIVAWMSYDHWRKKTLQGTIDKIYMIKEYPVEFVVYIRNDWPELIPILNKAIGALQQEKLPRITNKWFGEWPQKPKTAGVQLTPEERAWIAQQPPIRVTFSEHPPYFSFKTGKAAGIAVELLEKVSKITGVEFQTADEPYLFADELRGLINKSGPDVITAIMPTQEREKVILFTKPFMNSPRFIFTRDDAPFISKINDLFGKTVAVIKGYVTHKYLLEHYPDINLMVFGTNEEALRAVSTGKAFAYIGDLTSTPVAINQFGLQNLKAACPSGLPDHPLAMGVRNDWSELRNIVAKALDAIPAEEKAAIINKWSTVRVEYGISSEDLKQWGLLAVLSILSIITMFLLWNKQLSRRVAQRTVELSDSEARFRGIFEQAAVGIAHVSPEGQFLRLNQKFCDIVGYSHDEMQNLTFKDITYPDDLRMDLSLVQQLLDGRKDSYSLEKRYIRKGSSIVWVNLTVRVVRKDDGTPRWFVSVIEDISERINAQDRVRKSYEFLQHITTTVPDALFSVKMPERTVLWCNDHYGVIGYKPEECVGESTDMFYADPGEVKRVGDLLGDAISSNKDLLRTEVMLRRKNGEIFPAEVNLAVLWEASEVVSVTALARDISERKESERKALEYQNRLKQLASQLTLAEELERRRIAAELHDEVGQTLAFSQMQLAAVVREQDDAKIKEQLEQVSETLLKTTRETRNLIFELSSPTVHELGLSTAISEWFEEKLHNSHGIKLSLYDMLVGDELDEEQYTILFRNIREILTNVIKHARASEVQVSLEHVDDDVRITVKDNGIGFDPDQVARQTTAEGGFGIFSIEERMTDLGGKLEIKARPHQGCEVIMTLPIDQENGRPV